MQPPSITLLAPGTFTASDGQTFTFGPRELENIADSYDREADPAPLVIGTPDLADPAYGWVSALYVDGGQLKARVEKVEPSFKAMLQTGKFPKATARFYPPEANGNPKPGNWYLKHVSFTSSAPPKIRVGMQSFGEGSDVGTIGLDSTVVPFAAQLVAPSQYRASSGRLHVLNSYDVFDRMTAIQRENPGMTMMAAVQMAVDQIDAEVLPAKAGEAALPALGQDQISLRTANSLIAKNPALSLAEALEIASIANGGELALAEGYIADPARAALYVATMKRRAENAMLSFGEALREVTDQRRPELSDAALVRTAR